MVQSGFPVPPLHVRCAPLLVENAPELLALKESAPSCPVMLRISSRPQAPAWPIPSTQFRKGRRPAKKPFNPMEFSKSRARFRNWVLGEDFAGEYNAPGLPGITGSAGTLLGDADGAFFRQTLYPPERDYPHGVTLCFSVGMDASRCSPIYGRETTVMPPSINQPAILYLGRPA